MALPLTCYNTGHVNTGARAQELLDMRAGDLQLEPPRQVLLRGKGRKQRICPLWDETGQCGRPASRWPCNPPEAARAGLRAPSGPMVSTHLVRQEKSSFSSTDIEEIQQ